MRDEAHANPYGTRVKRIEEPVVRPCCSSNHVTMNGVTAFDLSYAARQLAVFTVLAFFPVIVFSYFIRSRLLPLVVFTSLPLGMLAWLWFIFQMWTSISRLWSFNFGRVHQTLRVTPAMEAGILDHLWSMEEIVGLLQ